MWSDPANQKEEWVNSDRGVSYTFNNDVINRFMTNNNIDLICRAHQMVDNGYQFTCGHKLVTVFSAPNYCDNSNSGAVMKVDKNLTCSFIILRPVAYLPKKQKIQNTF
jgi:serine/threonine-protein phosphatase PP1 catalytic subunit